MTPDAEDRIPDITLEQFLLGELSRRDADAVERALAASPRTRARLRKLQHSNREILERYPPELMAQLISARVERGRGAQRRVVFAPTAPLAWAAAAVIVIMLALVAFPGGSIDSPADEEALSEYIKGDGPQLTVYRRTADGSEILADGATAAAGDLLQLGYQAAGRSYGAIVAVDGRGTVTQVFPELGNHAALLTNGGTILLDFALELDDAPRWERFYFVAGDQPFEIQPLLRAAQRIDRNTAVDEPPRLQIEGGLDQFIFSLDKGTALR